MENPTAQRLQHSLHARFNTAINILLGAANAHDLRRWLTLLALCVSIILQYAIVLLPTSACGSCSGGAFLGSLFASAYVTAAGACFYIRPGPIAKHVFLGSLVSVIPASFTASTQVVISRIAAAVNAYGVDGAWIDPGQGLFHSTADTYALRGLKASNFRFDLMGQSHSKRSLDGPGILGTFCAVPIVPDGWTPAEVVPFWYVCNNYLGMFMDCDLAYKGVYNENDSYGWNSLSECLRKPEELIINANLTGSELLNPLMYFYQLYFAPNFDEVSATFFRKAITEASVFHRIMIRYDAPLLRLAQTQEPCCQILIKTTNDEAIIFSIVLVLPFVLACAWLNVYRFTFQHKFIEKASLLTRQHLKSIYLGHGR